jgi:hypothetical protein
LRLRSVQVELFLAALDDFESTRQPSRDLDELGGNLIDKARKSGWLEGGRLVLTPVERAVFFKIRWSELTGLRKDAPFVPTLDDWRVYYGFLLRHPEGGGSPEEALQKKLVYVGALSKRDSTYPAWFARGVLQYELGAYQEAAESFRAALAKDADGPYTLRAKNHLLSALAKVEATE